MNVIAESENERDIKDQLNGKTIERFEILEEYMDNFIVLYFTDKTKLMIRYDYIYEWKLLSV
jgi:hypothetical protein